MHILLLKKFQNLVTGQTMKFISNLLFHIPGNTLCLFQLVENQGQLLYDKVIDTRANGFFDDSLVKEGKLNLEEFKVTYLGRKGRLASIFSTLNELSSNDKPKAGVLFNDLKNEFNDKIDALSLNLKSKNNSTNIDADLTLPGDPYTTPTRSLLAQRPNIR